MQSGRVGCSCVGNLQIEHRWMFVYYQPVAGWVVNL